MALHREGLLLLAITTIQQTKIQNRGKTYYEREIKLEVFHALYMLFNTWKYLMPAMIKLAQETEYIPPNSSPKKIEL